MKEYALEPVCCDCSKPIASCVCTSPVCIVVLEGVPIEKEKQTDEYFSTEEIREALGGQHFWDKEEHHTVADFKFVDLTGEEVIHLKHEGIGLDDYYRLHRLIVSLQKNEKGAIP